MEISPRRSPHGRSEPIIFREAPEWLRLGQVASCLELRENIMSLHKNRRCPASWPRAVAPGSLLGKRNARGDRVPMSASEAEDLLAYWTRDEQDLKKYLPQNWEALGLTPLDWVATPNHVSSCRRSRERFANPQARMFPVAVTFLVPEKMAEEKR